MPLKATTRAREHHLISANAHSKAVLRTSDESLVDTVPDVHYFPSYELVTTCTRDAWEADQRHVSSHAVGQVDGPIRCHVHGPRRNYPSTTNHIL